MKCIILLIFIIFSAVTADICSRHAVLHEVDRFWLYELHENDEIDLSEFNNTIRSLQKYEKSFTERLLNYTNENFLDKSEPIPLTKLTSDTGVYPLSAVNFEFSARCKANSGKILELDDNINMTRLLDIMKSQNIDHIPINVFPGKKFLISRNFNPLSEQSYENLNMLSKGFAILSNSTQITMPTDSDISSTVKGLCQKKLNYWDLPDSRAKWLHFGKRLLKTLPLIKSLAGRFAPILKRAKTDISPFDFKIQPPRFITETLDTIQNLASKVSWEDLTVNDNNIFFKLLDNLKKFKTLFKRKTDTGSIAYSLPNADRIDFHEIFQSSPNSLTLPEAELHHKKDEIDGRDSLSLRVGVTNEDLIIIYEIIPLFYKGQIVSDKYLVKTPRTSYTTVGEPKGFKCVTNTAGKFCGGLVQASQARSLPDIDPILCAKALLNNSQSFNKCPLKRPDAEFLAFRAACEPFGSTIIDSNNVNLDISIICDGILQKSVSPTNYPAFMKHDCEIIGSSYNIPVFVLPQLKYYTQNKNFDIAYPFYENNTIITAGPELSLNNIITISTVSIGLFVFFLMLFLFYLIKDPAKCLSSFKNCTNCCTLSCKNNSCQNQNCCKDDSDTAESTSNSINPEMELKILKKHLPFIEQRIHQNISKSAPAVNIFEHLPLNRQANI